ncbi:MAG TPA: protein kinase, partial [Gemmatimonadales bacterium]|nr:protein kinase [Gemmatimonadales bacterium]
WAWWQDNGAAAILCAMPELLERLRAVLTDRYAIERELGRGGMATVFLAYDRKHERRVAIKVMGHDVAAQLGADRFLREIKTIAQLSHPNILPLYDSGGADGHLYYVMPFVEGGSLRDRLDREGALPLQDALEIAREVADALALAHSHGIIHRDIKPENILFIAGRPVVADFGIARAVSAAGGENLTQAGMAVGTPAYMSPEQAAGDPALDGRSDIYALGCVLYEMLAGRPPFTGRNAMEVLARHTMDAVPPLRGARPTVPPTVDQTVSRALAKIPADRFATAREFADAIAGRLAAGPAGKGAVWAGLLSGRVLAIVAGYALFTVLGWLAARWMADRFALSPYLPRFVLAALAFLLPAVVAVAYIVGNRGTRWRAAFTAGVSANLAAAVAALALLFGGKDLGAATTSVTLTDEEGNRVERVIPKGEFRKRIALFYFDAPAEDTAAVALSYAIPDAIGIDLLQDLFVDLRTPGHFRDRLRAAGRRDLRGVPLTLARDIAAQQFREEFVMGAVRSEGGDVVVSMTRYRTATGEKLTETEVRGSDPLVLADELATEIKGTVDVPEGYTGPVVDLPVNEILTTSPAAFGHYARGSRAITVDNDFAAAAAALEAAVREDSTFAMAHYLLYLAYIFSSRSQDALRSIQAAVDYAIRLPERLRNQVKGNYYEMRREPEKMYAVFEMNAELFPTDIVALSGLASTQVMRGRRLEAIATFRRILELDPQQYDYRRLIGDLYRDLGDYDRALENYRDYADANPTDRRGFLALGDVRRAQGDHAAAREAFERAALLEGGETEAAVRIADLDLDLGQFDRARGGYQTALAGARTPDDSVRAWDGLTRYAAARGRLGDLVGYREQAWAEEAKSVPPIQILFERMNALGEHVARGDTARALELLAEYQAQLQPPFDAFKPLGDLDIAIELEDPARIDSAAAGCEAMIRQFSYEVFRPAVAYARGQAHYLRGEYREAIAAWQEEQRLAPGEPSTFRQLGQAWRELGEHRRADAAFKEALRLRPADGRTRYEFALLEEARGHRERAVEHLRAALEVWADADPAYKWARRAREALSRLEGGR